MICPSVDMMFQGGKITIALFLASLFENLHVNLFWVLLLGILRLKQPQCSFYCGVPVWGTPKGGFISESAG